MSTCNATIDLDCRLLVCERHVNPGDRYTHSAWLDGGAIDVRWTDDAEGAKPNSAPNRTAWHQGGIVPSTFKVRITPHSDDRKTAWTP